MAKGNTFETEVLDHVLNNANIADIGDATGLRGSTADGDLYMAAHTSDPGEAGTQATNETTYGSYARQAISRDGTAWTVANGVATLNANVEFPVPSSGSGTLTHISIGVASSGATKLLYKGALSSPIDFTSGGAPPIVAAGSTVSES
jgi:hypothetical protein